MHAYCEKQAFPALAFKSLEYIRTNKQRKNIKNTDQTIEVTIIIGGVRWNVSMNRRKVTDKIVETFNCMHKNKTVTHALPALFEFPEYCTNQSSSPRRNSVNLSHRSNGLIIDTTQQAILERDYKRMLNDEEWAFLKFHIKCTNPSQFKQLRNACETGVYRCQNVDIPVPELRNFKMNLDTESFIAKYSKRRDDNNVDDNLWMQWMIRRLKLLQARYLDHEKYDEKINAEIDRVCRKLGLEVTQYQVQLKSCTEADGV